MSTYSGDETYDDDVTSGPVTDPLNDPKFVIEPGKGFNGRPEKFENHDGTIVIENPGMIWHLTTLRHAIKLEGMGMRHSSGRSALKHAKDLYGFKGNRAAVLEQMEAKLAELKKF